jgi:hypothetical protein
LWYLSADFFSKYFMPVSKKRVIKSLENLSDDLKELLRDQYPNGYESSITRITNAKKEPIFVFPLETEDATYLIKVPATKNSEGEYDVEATPGPEFEVAGVAAAAVVGAGAADDDDFGASDSYGEDEGGGEDDFDEEGGSRKSREASYDPDFDN